jgi:hypothetical protein
MRGLGIDWAKTQWFINRKPWLDAKQKKARRQQRRDKKSRETYNKFMFRRLMHTMPPEHIAEVLVDVLSFHRLLEKGIRKAGEVDLKRFVQKNVHGANSDSSTTAMKEALAPFKRTGYGAITDEICARHVAGESQKQISIATGRSRNQVYRTLKSKGLLDKKIPPEESLN